MTNETVKRFVDYLDDAPYEHDFERAAAVLSQAAAIRSLIDEGEWEPLEDHELLTLAARILPTEEKRDD